MAIVQGDVITADILNTINTSVPFYYNENLENLANQEAYWPSSSGVYSHRSSGFPIGTFHFTCGWFGGATYWMQKLVSGGWVNINPSPIWSDSVVFNTLDVYGTAYSSGPGFYRWHITWSGNPRATIFCGKRDCVKGDYIVYFDDPASSGNRIPDTKVTASIVNSGRCGTVPTL